MLDLAVALYNHRRSSSGSPVSEERVENASVSHNQSSMETEEPGDDISEGAWDDDGFDTERLRYHRADSSDLKIQLSTDIFDPTIGQSSHAGDYTCIVSYEYDKISVFGTNKPRVLILRLRWPATIDTITKGTLVTRQPSSNVGNHPSEHPFSPVLEGEDMLRSTAAGVRVTRDMIRRNLIKLANDRCGMKSLYTRQLEIGAFRVFVRDDTKDFNTIASVLAALLVLWDINECKLSGEFFDSRRYNFFYNDAGHRKKIEDLELMHCNVTPWNILTRKADDGRIYGILNDWDIATCMGGKPQYLILHPPRI